MYNNCNKINQKNITFYNNLLTVCMVETSTTMYYNILQYCFVLFFSLQVNTNKLKKQKKVKSGASLHSAYQNWI